jgi:hypothetical protein
MYPRQWRRRYGEEFDQLLADLAGDQPRRRHRVDIGIGALDAHWRGGFGMKRLFGDPALRRGFYDGLFIAAVIAIDVFLTNVVWPAGPDESDSDPEYIVQNLITYGIILLLLVLIGARAGRRTRTGRGGAKAGAAAGAVIAVVGSLTFVIVNNIWLSVVSQQHDKRIAFAQSGWTSMRAYLTVVQLEGMLFLLPALAVVGGVLGLIGGWLFKPRQPAKVSSL